MFCASGNKDGHCGYTKPNINKKNGGFAFPTQMDVHGCIMDVLNVLTYY